VKEPERVLRMDREILAKLAAIPGVHSAAMVNANTRDGNNSNDLLYAEDHPMAENKMPQVRTNKFVSPGFFATVGRRFVAGRDLTWDEVFGYRPAAIVSETLARDFWRDPRAALGKRIREGMKDDWREVVGVVADERDDAANQKAPAIAYWPFVMTNFRGNPVMLQRTMAFDLRTSRAGSAALLGEARKAVWSVAPNSPLANVRTLEDIYRMSMALTSFTPTMLANRLLHRDGGHDSDRDADARQRRALAHEHRADRALRRAQRHANADLAPPLGHRVRDHAVDADDPEDQRHRACESKRCCSESRRPIRRHTR